MLTAASSNAADSHSEIDDLAWLAGTWAGIGDDGTTTGDAYSVWTNPVEGVMSWTFRWHQTDTAFARFDCLENCRAASVEFARQDDGGLKESWRSTAGAAPGFVITYRRATPVEENMGKNQ